MCRIYEKRSMPFFLEQIMSGKHCLGALLERMSVKQVLLRDTIVPDSMLTNEQNTLAGSALGNQPGLIPIIAICGEKNSGKTTVLERTIPYLTVKGVRVGIIKHDGHDFDVDIPGTDTYRLRAAGAKCIGIYSSYKYFVLNEECDMQPEKIAEHFSNVDIILIEGGKHSNFPKIEIVRSEVSDRPICHANGLIAICTDRNTLDGLPCFDLEDYRGLADFLVSIISVP